MPKGISSPEEPMTYRRHYPKRWQNFIRDNFHSEQQVRSAFGIDKDTAANWWSGRNAPQGWAVDYAKELLKLGTPIEQ